jgi:hypothetical protein
MNFTATILAAGMLGFQAHAASDAFAAHRLALESILEPTDANAEDNYYTTHHTTRSYYPEDHYVYPAQESTHVYPQGPAPFHDRYDAFAHD